MEDLLRGIPSVAVYLDDILITGPSSEDHLKSLEEVVKRLANAGLRVKKHKCCFMAPSVSYLGYVIDSKGLHPLPDKVQAIQDAPTPRNVQELKSYLGLLTYYGKFIPNLATHLAPLYELLGKEIVWNKGITPILSAVGALRSKVAADLSVRCICLWNWCCVSTLPVGERGFVMRFWSKAFLLLFTGTSFRVSDRP